MHLPKPKALLFDWDNTIVDARSVILSALNKTLINYGKAPVQQYLGCSSREECFKNYFGEEWQIANKLFKQNLTAESFDELVFFEDIIPLLKNLKKDGIYTAIVSNKIGALLRKEVEYFKLAPYFNTIIGSGDSGGDKPSREPIISAMANSFININENNVYFVGDSIADLECAKNSGVMPILYHSAPPYNFEDVLQVKSHKNLMKMLGY